MKGDKMDGKELKESLAALGMTQRDFARKLDRIDGTVSDWCNDKTPIPVYVEAIVKQELALKTIAETAESGRFSNIRKNACDNPSDVA